MADPFGWGLGCSQCGCGSPVCTTCAPCVGGGLYGLTGTLTDANGTHTITWYSNGYWWCCYTLTLTVVTIDPTHGCVGPFTSRSVSAPIFYRVSCTPSGIPSVPFATIKRFYSTDVCSGTCYLALNPTACSANPTSVGSTSVTSSPLPLTGCDPMTATVASLAGACDPVGGSVSISIPKVAAGSPCCGPCTLPASNLTASWVNTSSGNSSATLVYDGATTWSTGCIDLGDGTSISITITCTGGVLTIDVEGDEDSPGCVSTRTYTLAASQLVQSTTTCSPLSVKYNVNAGVRLSTRQHFSSFTFTL